MTVDDDPVHTAAYFEADKWPEHPYWSHRYDFFTAEPNWGGEELASGTVRYVRPVVMPTARVAARKNMVGKMGMIGKLVPPSLVPQAPQGPRKRKPLYFQAFLWMDGGSHKVTTRADLMQVFERLVKPIDAAGQLVYDILAVLDQVDAVCDEEAAQSLEFTNARLRVEEAFHAIDLIMPKIMRLAVHFGIYLHRIADLERDHLLPVNWTPWPHPVTSTSIHQTEVHNPTSDYLFRLCRLIQKEGQPVFPEYDSTISAGNDAVKELEAMCDSIEVIDVDASVDEPGV